MIKVRVIPVVLWDGVNCVQTVRFCRPARVFGSLMDAVRLYERRNVDELIMIDISGADTPRFEDIKEFTSQLFCPVTVGGGVRSLHDIERLLKCGADKVSIKTAATSEFIYEASRRFGAQAIVLALDVAPLRKNWQTAAAVIARGAEAAGAGEILLTAIDRNGTMNGYDIDLIARVSDAVAIPVIAHGGCGRPHHMLEAIEAGAHAVAASTMFLFTDTTPRDCARYLAEHGIKTRVS